MNLKFRKFQEGGTMPEQQGGEQQSSEQQGGDPLMQIAQAAAQALQSNDCQMALQVCQAFIQLIQSSQSGAAPAPEESEPVYRSGGKLVRRIRK